jgi:hypothetical protein
LIRENLLFTYRTGDSSTFADTIKKMRVNPENLISGVDIMLLLFETRIDLDADLDEAAAKAGKAYPDLFGIYHIHKGNHIVFDEHPNALAHEMIAQKIVKTLKNE